MKSKTLLQVFRVIAIAEGISFLLLLGIAMPLKYMMDMPLAVKITGSLHGVLFVAFIMLAWWVMDRLNKNYFWFFKAFLASLLPFGTFIFDRSLKKDAEQLAVS